MIMIVSEEKLEESFLTLSVGWYAIYHACNRSPTRGNGESWRCPVVKIVHSISVFGLKWIDTIIRLHGYYVISHRNEFSRWLYMPGWWRLTKYWKLIGNYVTLPIIAQFFFSFLFTYLRSDDIECLINNCSFFIHYFIKCSGLVEFVIM